ncbi:response regulator [Alicyclobacillus tolerans]|uniref:Two component transcriptional regulator, LuxR family n=1 Tax=Alicyclobacillus tolerans TaxID=90970 RepID=A0A1M6N6X5_9BACL|nr:response regulator transcription factor [Alicyclobacillus montanus]SHJ91468.1 two component transcriptional regulator, LuxR family [Alicyclobacillus montanus]
MPIRVLLCDDHQVLRDSLAYLCNEEPDMEVVATCSRGSELMSCVTEIPIDVILLDINLPDGNGIEFAEELKNLQERPKLIVLTMYNYDEYLFRAIRAGADGYLLKDAPVSEVLAAIRAVHAGQSALPANLTQRLIQSVRGDLPTRERLSPRETEVLQLLVNGYSNKDIAGQLYISETTVKLHISNIFRKLQVRSRSQAILVAIREGLVPHLLDYHE